MPVNAHDTRRPFPLRQRFQPLLWLGVTFLIVCMLTRLALLLVTGDGIPASPSLWLYAFGVGFGYDLLTLLYFALPLVLWLWLLPTRWLLSRPGRIALGALCFLLLCVMLFVALSEWTFWEEFQTRFNFIAVDYLVYTTEVIGNIRESYPVGWLLTGLGATAVVVFFATRRWHRAQDGGTSFAGRSIVGASWLLLTVSAIWLVGADLKDRTDNQYVNELAGNGIYQFFAAYRSASLDYDRFYRSLPLDQAFVQVRRQLQSPDARFVSNQPTDIIREIHNAAPERRLNVVLISVESLSADFSGTYGRVESLTPQLDALTKDSLLFTRLFATGTRTVRGLEALALSVPPTPGESIVKRPHNEGLASLAEVFNRKGYVSQFLYGGYGAFDNMNYFFANNGYEVHDRGQIDKNTIQHGNIWGVSDEDLYTMALGEFDKASAAGKPFFAHVMTTSNHRPYTFPEGRGPWPQGKRNSAVAYSDWAIGDFLKRARSKPWFANTVFVLTADHCASSGGKASLPVFRYHIPLWIYSPGNIAPQRWDRLTSQIDIAPTLLGLLGMDYQSSFYGADVMQQTAGRERAFLGTYQLLGYLRNDQLVQLGPHRRADAVQPSYSDDRPQQRLPLDNALALEAVSYYQTASYRFTHGLMAQHAQ
ncbi:MAG: sulfatase-like hydrolase/transferase [Lysobacter sp.]|nr:sulfatase-like hydrolase/transferase [Lysobacter sp.]